MTAQRLRTPRERLRAALALVLCVACADCGGGGGGGTIGTNPPPTTSPPPAGGSNPCGTALEAEGLFEPQEIQVNASPEAQRKRENIRGRTKGDVREALWTHRAPDPRSAVTRPADVAQPAATVDIGEIAVIEDNGTIFRAANTFDLENTGLRFQRSGSGYNVSRTDASFRASLGNRLTLRDDDFVRVDLPASVSFFGASYSGAFVNSDGNITFDRGDNSSSDRSVGRFLGGAPRLAAFFADLDPSAGGRVFADASASGLTVTWCAVPGFESTNTVNVQATVLADGTVEVKFGTVRLRDGVVGVSPGGTETFAAVDLTGSGTVSGGSGAVGERFGAADEADLIAAALQFYRTHPDTFDQLVFWGETSLLQQGEAFAQEITVNNQIRGIGVPPVRTATEFGSAGRLQSVVNMDRIAKYPADPAQKFLGEDTVLSLLGQESGHRWLAFVEFQDVNRRNSTELLGRDDAHWSFFFDSDASVMEGNDIEALGGGAFRTVGAVSRFSRLDQYIMGLIPPGDVPPFFYVESPTNVQPGRERDSAPRVGVTFNGTKRDVLINEVIAAMGERVPSAAESPKVWRQAWIYLVRRGTNAAPADISKIDTWRTAWETFFFQGTENRMRLEARVR